MLCNIPDGHALLPGALDHLVFTIVPVSGEVSHVGHIHDMVHLVSGVFQSPSKNIFKCIGPHVSNMSIIVNSGTAGAVHLNSSVSLSQIHLTVLPTRGSPIIIVVVYKLINMKRKINIRGSLREQEPLKNHTSFRIGGKADLFAEPLDEVDLLNLLYDLKEMEIPWFILGGGANILIADKGIRGMVISMARLDSVVLKGKILKLGAGLPVSDGAAYAADKSLKGLEFIYSMPGSVEPCG
jgi:hypothetical protein